MSWFCSGYSPRRFLFGIVRGLKVTKTFAKVWSPRSGSAWYWITVFNRTGKTDSAWYWITIFNRTGATDSASKAMRAAEKSLEREKEK